MQRRKTRQEELDEINELFNSIADFNFSFPKRFPLAQELNELIIKLKNDANEFRQEVMQIRPKYGEFNEEHLAKTDTDLITFLNATKSLLENIQPICDYVIAKKQPADSIGIGTRFLNIQNSLTSINESAAKLNEGYGWNKKTKQKYGALLMTVSVLWLGMGVAAVATGVGIPFAIMLGAMWLATGAATGIYSGFLLGKDAEVDKLSKQVDKRTKEKATTVEGAHTLFTNVQTNITNSVSPGKDSGDHPETKHEKKK